MAHLLKMTRGSQRSVRQSVLSKTFVECACCRAVADSFKYICDSKSIYSKIRTLVIWRTVRASQMKNKNERLKVKTCVQMKSIPNTQLDSAIRFCYFVRVVFLFSSVHSTNTCICCRLVLLEPTCTYVNFSKIICAKKKKLIEYSTFSMHCIDA